MTENSSDLPSLVLINNYVAALHERNDAAMQKLRAPDFVLDWVHSDVFADTPFALLPEEMEWMTRYGMSNMEVIESATRMGAEALGMEHKFGTIEAGKFADLIMVNRDPLTDISVFKEVSWVMKEGTVIPIQQEWKRRPVKKPITL